MCGEPRKRLTSHAVESGSFELRTAEKQRLRVGDVAGGGTKCQRLHEVLLGDRCADRGGRVTSFARASSYAKASA